MLVRAAREAMRCRFELVLEGADERFLGAVAEEVLDEIELWGRRLSRFRRDSLVSHLERHAHLRPVPLDDEIYELFALAEEVRLASGGAFDIAWRSGGTVLLDPRARTLALSGPEVRLDLGAIGKGFAIDRAVELLRANELERALLHGGSSTVHALGAPPGCNGWRVAFADLAGLGSVELRDAACSVSAQTGRTLEDGGGHVRDPRDLAVPPTPRPVAVRGPSAALADAWSTALLVDPTRAPEAAGRGVVLLTTAPAV